MDSKIKYNDSNNKLQYIPTKSQQTQNRTKPKMNNRQMSKMSKANLSPD